MKHVEVPASASRKPTRTEQKHEVTTAAALQIINGEEAARKAKTDRLRAARLAATAAPETATSKRRGKK